MTTHCLKCRAPLAPHTGPGRPASYCGSACRRLAEYEIRRIDRRLADYVLKLREAQADREPYGVDTDHLGRTKRQRVADLRKWIAEDEDRLRALVCDEAA
jgi:hypothetical protein